MRQSTDTSQSSELPEIEPSFNSDTIMRLFRWQALLQYNPDLLHAGPEYKCETSKGMPLTITSAFAHFADTFRNIAAPNPKAKRLFVLLAQDRHSRVVGCRFLSFGSGYGENPIECSPRMVTGVRGMGIATPLGTAGLDIAQKHADELRKPVLLKAHNENLDNLQIFREKVRNDCSEAAQLELQAKETEQVRWQHLWGDDGRFGLVDGKKTFYPNGDSAPVNQYGLIVPGKSTEILSDRDISTRRGLQLMKLSKLCAQVKKQFEQS
jgi:hypothetical protein